MGRAGLDELLVMSDEFSASRRVTIKDETVETVEGI